jgi:hypothetical protein
LEEILKEQKKLQVVTYLIGMQPEIKKLIRDIAKSYLSTIEQFETDTSEILKIQEQIKELQKKIDEIRGKNAKIYKKFMDEIVEQTYLTNAIQYIYQLYQSGGIRKEVASAVIASATTEFLQGLYVEAIKRTSIDDRIFSYIVNKYSKIVDIDISRPRIPIIEMLIELYPEQVCNTLIKSGKKDEAYIIGFKYMIPSIILSEDASKRIIELIKEEMKSGKYRADIITADTFKDFASKKYEALDFSSIYPILDRLPEAKELFNELIKLYRFGIIFEIQSGKVVMSIAHALSTGTMFPDRIENIILNMSCDGFIYPFDIRYIR